MDELIKGQSDRKMKIQSWASHPDANGQAGGIL